MFLIIFAKPFNFTDDVNADGRADVVCTLNGGVMVWEAKEENTNIYDPSSKWMDDKFGFCVFQEKQVRFVITFVL